MRILIVDDDTLIRDGLKMILECEKDMEVVGTASNGQEAVSLCTKCYPDIILMDIRMPVMDGVQATKLIKEQFSDIKILMLTTYKDVEYIRSAIKFGAEGYILKTSSSNSIIEGIRVIHSGNVIFKKEVAEVISDIVEEKKAGKNKFDLTPKEYEIMELVSKGLSNKEIADKLYMGEGTIRNNISNILSKLELRDRTQMAIFYIRNIE